MNDGQDFTLKDLTKNAPSGSGDMFDKINNVLKNADSVLTHFAKLKADNPQLGAGQKTGNPFAKTQGQAGQAVQFSPTNQPSQQAQIIKPQKKLSSVKLYTAILGLLHQAELKKLSLANIKKLAIANKSLVLAKLDSIIESGELEE